MGRWRPAVRSQMMDLVGGRLAAFVCAPGVGTRPDRQLSSFPGLEETGPQWPSTNHVNG